MKTHTSDAQTKLTLAAAMVIFGTIGLLRRLIDLPSAAISCCRGLLGCVFLLLMQCLRGRKPDWAALRPKLWLLLLSALVLHEKLSAFGIIGAVLVLGATVLSDLLDRRAARKPA